MNARKREMLLQVALVVVMVQAARADSVRVATSQGNALYKQGNFNEAINKYDQALVDAPEAMEPKFNKANSYYRLDDLGAAIDLYREVAAASKDMRLVAKAKYNLGNSYYQQSSKQRDSNVQKAIEDLETAISSWRGVLDVEPANQKAARNIEVARLMIKDLLDQLNKQKQQHDPNQPRDPNQQSQQDQQKQGSQQDPNQPHGQKQQPQAFSREPNQLQEPNRPQKQPKEGQKEPEQTGALDAMAQLILDREQQQRKERQVMETGAWQKVEKDW